MSRGTLDVEHSGQEEEPRRGGPPKKGRESEATGCFLPTDKKAFFMARYVQDFFFLIVCLTAYLV